jgi:DNA polymerase-3 subunit alpha (Gram-positive type)
MANIIIEISDEGMPQLPEEDTSSPLILGNSMNISDPLVKITDLNAESGNVCIDGEILGMEDKETKTGKVILSINIYDGTSTMTCKAFLPGKNAKNIVKRLPNS